MAGIPTTIKSRRASRAAPGAGRGDASRDADTEATDSTISDERALKAAELVARDLRNQIARGELVPGDRLLTEDDLMKHFGVARTMLREGLRILESQGLVEIRRGRNGGPEVTAPSVEPLARGFALHLQLQHTTVGDLDEARQLIEPWLAARLARNHTAADLAALDQAIELAADAADRNDKEAFGNAAALVHETIGQRAGNQTLALVGTLLHELVAGYYQHVVGAAPQQSMKRAVRSYRKLHRLIATRDVAGAEEHWRRQMTYTISHTDRGIPIDVVGVSD